MLYHIRKESNKTKSTNTLKIKLIEVIVHTLTILPRKYFYSDINIFISLLFQSYTQVDLDNL